MALVSEPFQEIAMLTAESAGLATLRIGRLRTSALSNLTDEEIRQATEPCIDEIIDGLTTALKIPGMLEEAPGEAVDNMSFEEFEGVGSETSWDVMNGAFLEFGWSDGLPIVPPTEERVNALLATTQRNPDEVIGILEPGMGLCARA